MPQSGWDRSSAAMLLAAKAQAAAAMWLAGSAALASTDPRVCRPVKVVGALTLRRSTWNQRRGHERVLGEESDGHVGVRPSVRGWRRAGVGGRQVFSLEWLSDGEAGRGS
jgi:hypothetical protein